MITLVCNPSDPSPSYIGNGQSDTDPADFGPADTHFSPGKLDSSDLDTVATSPDSAGTGPAENTPIEAILIEQWPSGIDSDTAVTGPATGVMTHSGAGTGLAAATTRSNCCPN